MRREVPTSSIRGRFLILEDVIHALEELLPTYRGPTGAHEGIAFLFGHQHTGADMTMLTTAIAPEADHRRQYVRCSEEQVAAATSAARAYGLGLLGQVHSHPGECTIHSEGDDEMVLMPFAGMLSIVVPSYAVSRLRPLDGLGIHQFQDGRWVLVDGESVRNNMAVVPSSVDLR